jgi:predicted nucleic acid-binding protein
MTRFAFRPVAIVTLAVLMFAGAAASQTTSPVLNTLEVQMLVASNTPADNAKLSAHFAALAGRYAADAKRHAAMASAFIGAPTRRVPANTASDHCKRLAQLNTQSAETLNELAAHHKQLAGGVASTAPPAGARFQAGAGAPEPTDAELRALAAKASTPADHRALEEYFLTAARRYTADANAHVTMGQAYRGTRIVQAAAHCDRLVTLSRDSAKEAAEEAAMHKQLAGVAR